MSLEVEEPTAVIEQILFTQVLSILSCDLKKFILRM